MQRETPGDVKPSSLSLDELFAGPSASVEQKSAVGSQDVKSVAVESVKLAKDWVESGSGCVLCCICAIVLIPLELQQT